MSKNHWLVIISIFILSIAVRVYGLGERALWADEKVTALCSNGLIGVSGNDTNTININGEIKTKKLSDIKKATLIQDSGNGILYYFLLSHWTNWFGNSDFSLRFPSFIAGILFLVFGFLFVNKRFNTNTALLFLISSSVFSLFIIYSQTARSYEMALLTTFLSTSFFWKIIDSEEIKTKNAKFYLYVSSYLLLIFASIFLHYYTFYIIAGHAIYLTLHCIKKKNLLYVFSFVYLVFSLLFLYWMLNGGLDGYKFMADRNSWWIEQAKASGTFLNSSYLTKSFATFIVSMTGVYMSYIKEFNIFLLIPYIAALLIIFFTSFKIKYKVSKEITLFIYTIVIQLIFAVAVVVKNGHALSLSPYYNIFTIPYILILIAHISNQIIINNKKTKIVFLFYSIFLAYNLTFLYFYHSKRNIHHSDVGNPYVEAAIIIENKTVLGDTVTSRQWIDGQLISLYTKKPFVFSCNPNLEKDEIYINRKGSSQLTILNLEGKRY